MRTPIATVPRKPGSPRSVWIEASTAVRSGGQFGAASMVCIIGRGVLIVDCRSLKALEASGSAHFLDRLGLSAITPGASLGFAVPPR